MARSNNLGVGAEFSARPEHDGIKSITAGFFTKFSVNQISIAKKNDPFLATMLYRQATGKTIEILYLYEVGKRHSTEGAIKTASTRLLQCFLCHLLTPLLDLQGFVNI